MIASLLVMALIACGKKREAPRAGDDAGKNVGNVIGDAGAGSAIPATDARIDPKEAVAQFDKACIAGDFEACRNLGVMYTEGIGVTADPRRATALFAQACNGGNLAACNHVALALAEGMGTEKDVAKAIELYTKACDGGYALACRNVGLMLRDGRGVPADLARAETLLGKACTGGAPFACTNAGDLDKALATKPGEAKDARYRQMLERYKQGCEAGDPSACRSIGISYLEGVGLPKSTGAGAVWLARACERDDVIACRVIGAMTLQGIGVKQDVARGRELLQRACDRKDAEACGVLKASGGSAGDSPAGAVRDAGPTNGPTASDAALPGATPRE